MSRILLKDMQVKNARWQSRCVLYMEFCVPRGEGHDFHCAGSMRTGAGAWV